MSKIGFRVCFSSGEDPDFPASELDVHSPQTKGWQSPRFCDYPQEIGLAMEARANLSRVQILSHQSKIASKIELYIGDGPSYEQAHFERLGYLSLNSNQRSNYQARELKSVFINCTGRYLRILAHRCYVNKYNLFNQVGLIAVNLLGEVAADEEQHHLHAEVVQQHQPAVDRPPSSIAGVGIGGGGGGGARPPSTLPPEPQDLAYQLSPFDPETTRQLAALTEAKEAAVRVEEYDTAKRLKAAERELRTLGEEISQLEARKQEAVRVEDYDRAKALKAEIAVLRRNMDARLRPVLASAGLKTPPATGQAPLPMYAPPSPPTTTTLPQQQPPPAAPQEQQQQPHQQQPQRSFTPYSYAPNPYDEIPVGGVGSAAQQARAAVYAASRSMSSSSDNAPHHQLHYASDPVVTSPGGPAGGYSATAAGGESGAGGVAAAAASPSRKGNAVFDEDAPIVVANRPAAMLIGDDGGSGAEAGSPLSSAADPSWAYQGSGPHPLDGVPNHRELPPPEPLPHGSKVPGLDPTDVNAIKHFLGEYVARCLFSRTWALRDAALLKARLLMQDAASSSSSGSSSDALDIKEALPALSDALALGLDDKIAQVFMTSLGLLDALLAAAQQAKMKRSQAGPLMEPVISILVAKLGDGQARIREAALAGLLAMAKSPCVGPGGLGPYALRRLPPKQLSAGKTVLCRLQLLRTLVEETKLGATSGLSADGVMSFMKEVKAFSHSSNEVRDAAREVTVAVYQVIGPRVLRYIEPLLRRKQMDEYEEAFRRVGGGGGGAGGNYGEGEEEDGAREVAAKRRGSGGAGGAGGVERERPWAAASAARTSPPSGSKGRPGSGGQGQTRGAGQQQRQQQPQQRQPRASPPRQQHQQQAIDFEISDSFDEELGAEGEEFGEEGDEGDAQTCQFCGRYDPGFSEDALDHHYFVECPLLMRCSECGQVIEIFGLAEHLLTECEFKDAYAPCPKSGLAVRRDQLEAWEAGPGAYFEKALHAGSSPGKKPPQHHALCPLCFYDIRPPTEEGIRSHYVGQCVNNPRRPGSGVDGAGAGAGGGVSA